MVLIEKIMKCFTKQDGAPLTIRKREKNAFKMYKDDVIFDCLPGTSYNRHMPHRTRPTPGWRSP